MYELCGGGRTIVLVSHGLSSIRSMATTAMWLHQGESSSTAIPTTSSAKYMRYCRLEASAPTGTTSEIDVAASARDQPGM